MISLDFSDWSFGGNSEREEEVTDFLQELFTDFWLDKQLENLSESKQELYSGISICWEKYWLCMQSLIRKARKRRCPPASSSWRM